MRDPIELPSAANTAALERLALTIPGGAHTYAKGPDQFPEGMAPVIARGSGAHVWDVAGNEYIEFGSGLRSVALGHAHPKVTQRVRESLELGMNYSRPSIMEAEAGEQLLDSVPAADMVKFTKNGSDATTAALRLARAVTGRNGVAYCADHPFFSTDDWFIGTTPMQAGIPPSAVADSVGFPYGDLTALEEVLRTEQMAAVIMQATTDPDPPDGYLAGVRDLCDRYCALLIFDEMITGFRWHPGGAQTKYGIRPDLSTFGKALGNGFAVSALLGRREFMERGGLHTKQPRVFLLSTTHGAETVGLAAARAVIDTYREESIIAQLERLGTGLIQRVQQVTAAHGLSKHITLHGRTSNLVFATRNESLQPSQEFRTLFLQQLLRGGVLAPSFVVSAALTDADLDRTADAVDNACAVYRKALENGIAGYLPGRPVKPIMREFS